MKMKKKLIVMLINLIISSIVAQNQINYPNITPSSPIAYELSKFGQIPIGLFTGSINTSINLHEYKTKNLSLPIILNYATNGIKVDQMETNVGLGWSLNIGGVISRIIRNKPDEVNYSFYPEGSGYDFYNQDVKMFFYNAGQGDIDTEKDIYFFNVAGCSGKFIYNNDNNILQLPQSSFSIKSVTENSITGFLLVASNGVRFFFLDCETSKCTNENVTSMGVTAWYLTRIEHPYGDKIFLEYDDQNYSYFSGTSQTMKIAYPYIQPTVCESNVSTIPIVTTNKSNMIINGKRLKKIYSNCIFDESVSFISNTQHPDCVGFKLLDTINISDNKDNIVNSYDFNYVFTSNKRVFLNKVNTNIPNYQHQFEYINKDIFPKRLSYSQDHWGYYNNQNNGNYLIPKILDQPPFRDINLGGNRELNQSAVQCGLLSKIIYPTGGYSEVAYESNSYFGIGLISPALYTTEEVSAVSNSIGFGGSEFTVTKTVNIPYNQKIKLGIGVITDETCIGGFYPDKARCNFKLINNSTNSIVTLLYQNGNYIVEKVGYGFSRNDCVHEYFAEVPAGSYTLEITPTYKCVEATASLNYMYKEALLGDMNIPSGGVRVKATNLFDPTVNKKEEKKYYYSSINNFNKSSGSIGYYPTYIYGITEKTACRSNTSGTYIDEAKYSILTSSSLSSLYNCSDNNMYYEYVTISFGGSNFENGAEEHHFLINPDKEANLIWGTNFIPNTPFLNSGWSHGLEDRVVIYSKKNDNELLKIKEIKNNYVDDNRKYNELNSYVVRKNYPNILENYSIDNLDIMNYTISSYWFYQNFKEITEYDNSGQNPIITRECYSYDNPSHMQITKKEILNSDKSKIQYKYYYSDESNLTNLINQHRISDIIKIEQLTSDNLLETSLITYKDWGNNFIAPEYIKYIYKDNIPIDKYRIIKYDILNGNIIEVVEHDNKHVTYLWGYNGKYLIAKIVGCEYDTVSNVISINNIDAICNQGDVALLRFLQTLRNDYRIKNAQVTTYTYKPLVGMTSKTDPRGITTYYEYDGLGQLKYIKDKDGKILQNIDYHYKP